MTLAIFSWNVVTSSEALQKKEWQVINKNLWLSNSPNEWELTWFSSSSTTTSNEVVALIEIFHLYWRLVRPMELAEKSGIWRKPDFSRAWKKIFSFTANKSSELCSPFGGSASKIPGIKLALTLEDLFLFFFRGIFTVFRIKALAELDCERSGTIWRLFCCAAAAAAAGTGAENSPRLWNFLERLAMICLSKLLTVIDLMKNFISMKSEVNNKNFSLLY